MADLLLHENILKSLMETIEETLGLYFPREKWGDLERALLSVCSETGYESIDLFAGRIIGCLLDRNEMEALASALTVGETYFFRETGSLKALEYHILPEIVNKAAVKGRRIRIWSAGCATGEEPYTVAMIIKNVIPDIDGWDIKILATDINMQFIKRALAGVYGAWSFRDVPHFITDKYFVKKSENRFELKDEIKEMVSFSYLNLMDNSYPSVLNETNGMDVILCRNVLMYFSGDNIKKVVSKVHSALNEGGYFIVSQTELSEYYFHDFRSLSYPGAVIYQKDSFRKIQNDIIPPVFPGSEIKRETLNPRSEPEVSVISGYTSPSMDKSFTENHPADVHDASDEIADIIKLYQEGEHEAAVNKLVHYVADVRDNPDAYALLSRIYADKGMPEDAVRYCLEAVKIDGLNPGYHFLLASIYKETGNLADAVSSLRNVIYLNPGFIMAYYNLGIIALGQNKSGDAGKNFDTALSLLKKIRPDEDVPESGGIPADRLAEIIESVKMRL